MKRAKFLGGLLLAALLLAGCKKSDADAAAAPVGNGLPKQAQPKLPTMKIYLGAETLDAELALTPREQQTGHDVPHRVTEESAMLFVLPRRYALRRVLDEKLS